MYVPSKRVDVGYRIGRIISAPQTVKEPLSILVARGSEYRKLVKTA